MYWLEGVCSFTQHAHTTPASCHAQFHFPMLFSLCQHFSVLLPPSEMVSGRQPTPLERQQIHNKSKPGRGNHFSHPHRLAERKRSRTELEQDVIVGLDTIGQEGFFALVRRVCDSIPDRCLAVVRAPGDATQYDPVAVVLASGPCSPANPCWLG